MKRMSMRLGATLMGSIGAVAVIAMWLVHQLMIEMGQMAELAWWAYALAFVTGCFGALGVWFVAEVATRQPGWVIIEEPEPVYYHDEYGGRLRRF